MILVVVVLLVALGKCRSTQSLIHCWWVCQLVQPLWKTIWHELMKLNHHMPYAQQIHSLLMCHRDVSKNIHSYSIHSSKYLETIQMP